MEEISSYVDTDTLAAQISGWDIPSIVDFIVSIDNYRAETELSEPLRDYFVEVMNGEEGTEVSEKVEKPWPFNIEDPVRAIHFAVDRECPWRNPSNCPAENNARMYIQAYEDWLTYNG